MLKPNLLIVYTEPGPYYKLILTSLCLNMEFTEQMNIEVHMNGKSSFAVQDMHTLCGPLWEQLVDISQQQRHLWQSWRRLKRVKNDFLIVDI